MKNVEKTRSNDYETFFFFFFLVDLFPPVVF